MRFLFQFLKDEQFVEFQKRREKSKDIHSTVSLTLTYYLSYLKTTVEDFKRFFSYKMKEVIFKPFLKTSSC